ncbi:aminopeptidase [Brucepastera parasyntrophica]|uniref:aminopeptidase n=1 Tax=Brucepastera parasyntrophica TaxID=2880008 RepID=UPI00210EFCF9|nr:aminopeptidase [Brucepastera parasyntrophica]ULQ60972.1 aminopeptidase [Brucepastera parasyntrophica]
MSDIVFSKNRKFLLLLSFAVVQFITAGCGNNSVNEAERHMFSAAIPVSEMSLRENLDSPTKQMLEIVNHAQQFLSDRLDLKKNEIMYYAPLTCPALCWELVSVKAASLEVLSRQYFYSEQTAVTAAEEAAAQGKETVIIPHKSIYMISERPSPVFPALRTLKYEELAEWTIREILDAYFSRTLKNYTDDGLLIFATEQATLAFLRHSVNPSSSVISAYMSKMHDDRTFAILFQEYQNRIKTLYSLNLGEEEFSRQKNYLIKVWIDNYTFLYPERFITSAYSDFPKRTMSAAELAAWKNPYTFYGDWEELYIPYRNIFVFIADLPEVYGRKN